MISSLVLILLAGSHLAQAAEILVPAASGLASGEASRRQVFAGETGHWVRSVLQSSGMLARQVQDRVPDDVYRSANESYVRQLVDSDDVAASTVVVYAEGRLGMWSADRSVEIPDDLAESVVRNIAMANPAPAQCGSAAKQALVSRNVWDVLRPKIVLAENVRQTCQYGRSRNAGAIPTCCTLVFDQGGRILPAEWHAPIWPAGGVVPCSGSSAVARRIEESP